MEEQPWRQYLLLDVQASNAVATLIYVKHKASRQHRISLERFACLSTNSVRSTMQRKRSSKFSLASPSIGAASTTNIHISWDQLHVSPYCIYTEITGRKSSIAWQYAICDILSLCPQETESASDTQFATYSFACSRLRSSGSLWGCFCSI